MKNKVIEKAELCSLTENEIHICWSHAASFIINEHGFNNIYYSLKVLPFPVRFECCKMLYLDIFNRIYLN